MSTLLPMYGRSLPLLGGVTNLVDPFRYPETDDEWQSWYDYRLDAYYGNNYSQDMVKALNLFRALDDDGDVLGVTRRLHRDIQHVVDVGAAAVSRRLVLMAGEDGEALLEQARPIWRRSASQIGTWGRMLCALGDYYIEPTRIDAQQVQMVGHDPRNVQIQYSNDGRDQILKAVVTYTYFDEDLEVAPDGSVISQQTPHTYQRVLTADEIIISKDGHEIERAPHGLGVVPIVHLRCIALSTPEHSLWSGHGIDRPLAEIDSLMSQLSAIGDRFANPKLFVKGAKVSDESKISRFGRIINLYGGSREALSAADARYIEPSLSGASVLLNAINQLLADVRSSLPEFLFGGAGANASGDALKFRSAQFESKYEEIRERFLAGLMEALAMSLSMLNLETYRAEYADRLFISAPPLLPVDRAAELSALEAADRLGAISAADKVRHLQRLGLVPDGVNPEDYSANLADLSSDFASTFFNAGEE